MAADLKKRKKWEQERIWLEQLVSQIQLKGFYGKITLTFEQGHIRRVQKEESLKPPVHAVGSSESRDL